MRLYDKLKREPPKIYWWEKLAYVVCGVGLPLAFFLWVLSVAIRLVKL